MLSLSKWIGAIFKSSWYQLSQSRVALGHTNWRLNVLFVRRMMHPTLLCEVGRNSFIFVARASLSFILMSWQVWLSLCWDGQLSHTRLHKIAETQLFPQLLSFGIYAGALLTNSSVAPQHRNPIPKVATENSFYNKSNQELRQALKTFPYCCSVHHRPSERTSETVCPRLWPALSV